MSLADYHLKGLKIGIVGYIVFCFLTYEYASLSRTCNIQETLDSLPRSYNKLLFSQCIILSSLLLIWCFNFFCWIIDAYFLFCVDYSPYFINAILSVVLDLALPGLIAILLGAFLALSAKREVAYSIIVLSALFCSPVPSKLLSSEAIFGYPILSAFDWFSILAPNTDWVADALYGVSVEPHRWLLVVFWIAAFLSLLIYLTDKNNKVNHIFTICFAVISLLAGAQFMHRGNDCIVKKDYRPNGTLLGEYSYRINNPLQAEKDAVFSVEKYIIDLSIRNSTEADVHLYLSRNETGEYAFTLFHGYTIERIEDANKNSLNYELNGDFITVYADNEIEEMHFVYSGNAGKYYANYQGIALPGYLPFYPIPGHIKLWESSQNEVVVNTNREVSYYEVTVDSNLTVASNLPCRSNNCFSGYSQAVSLYAGMQTNRTGADTTFWYSPVGYLSFDLDGYKGEWKRLSNQVGEASDFDLTGITVFIQPMTILSTNASQEAYAEFDDHLIIGGWSISSKTLCISHLLTLIPKNRSTDLLSGVFADYLYFGEKNEYSPVTWSTIEILAKYDSANEILDDVEWTNYLNAKNRFSDLFNYKVKQLGEQYVLESVYQYLLEPDCNQVEFLYNMGA